MFQPGKINNLEVKIQHQINLPSIHTDITVTRKYQSQLKLLSRWNFLANISTYNHFSLDYLFWTTLIPHSIPIQSCFSKRNLGSFTGTMFSFVGGKFQLKSDILISNQEGISCCFHKWIKQISKCSTETDQNQWNIFSDMYQC